MSLTPESFRAWVVPQLKSLRCGDRIVEAYLTGSRSPLSDKSPRPDSDWDILLVLRDERSIQDTGPLIHHRLVAPDNNKIEILRCDMESWESPNPNHFFVVTCKANGYRLI
jgi:predicted nucleotidyltransferase